MATSRNLGRADRGAHAAPGRTDRGHQLGHDAALEPAALEARLRLVGRENRRELAVEENAGNVAHEEDSLGAEADGEGGSRLVRIDVEGAGGERRDDRDASFGQRLDDRCRRAGLRIADEPERLDRRARRPISSPLSPTAAGPIAAQTSALTAASDSRTTSRTSGVVTRRPATNAGAIPRRSISAVICGPAPWTTTTPPSIPGERRADGPCGDPTAELQDDGHVVYSALSFT